MAAEGDTYVVDWRLIEGRYEARLRARPSIRVEADSLDELLAALQDAILEWRGDGEAVVEMVPKPHEKSVGGEAEFLALSYNERVQVANELSTLFAGGVCPKCGCGRGERSDVRLVLVRKPTGDVFRAERPWPHDVMPARVCVSERIVSLLSETEQEQLGLRSIDPCKGVKQSYFEICGPSVASTVSLKGSEYLTGLGQSWRCSACGKSAFLTKDRSVSPSVRYLALSSLREVRGDCFLFDESGTCGPRPAFVPERWKQIVNSPGLKGVSSSEIVVLQDERADPCPELPDYQ